MKYDEEGWPVDEDNRRIDPIGRFLESLTERQRRAWNATFTEDVPKLVVSNDEIKIVYPKIENESETDT